MDNNYLMEEYTAKVAVAPVDLNTAAVTGARIGLVKGKRVAVIVNMNTSVAAVVQITMKQHNAAVAGTSKDLVVANPYFVKAGAATSFTKVEPTVAAALKDVSTDFAANGGLVVFEVLAEDLDVNNGFTHFSIDIADSTAAKLASAEYVLRDMKFEPAYSEVI